MTLGYTVPNQSDATALGNTDFANLDSQDFRLIQQAFAGYGVLSGCEVTAQATPDMTVVVAAGEVRAGAQDIHVTGGTSLAYSSNATNPKYAFVEISAQGNNADGNIIRNSGTAAASPVFPTATPGNVIIAVIYIPAAATNIGGGAGQGIILDKRFILNDSFSTPGKLFLSSVDWTRSRP